MPSLPPPNKNGPPSPLRGGGPGRGIARVQSGNPGRNFRTCPTGAKAGQNLPDRPQADQNL